MLPLYYYNKVEIASVFHIHVCRMWKTHRFQYPRRGRACPARALSAAARYCFTHPVSPLQSFVHPPVGAGHARPATSRRLPLIFHRPPIPPNYLIPQPACHLPPPIICARQPPSPQYTPCPNFTRKLCRKNQKNLQKPVDKGHTTCYNNQAVSRAQPAAAAAGAFTYSLYAVF